MLRKTIFFNITKMRRILLTGVCGAIGQNLRPYLISHGYEVIGLDIQSGADIQADIRQSLSYISQKPIDAVIHLAALIDVGASMRNPSDYYTTNVVGTLNILKWMHQNNVHRLIFSSTAAVYTDCAEPEADCKRNCAEPEADCKRNCAEPEADCKRNCAGRLSESTTTNPSSVYGRTKLICEQIISDLTSIYGWQTVILRTFNVAGMLDILEPRHLIPKLVCSFIDGNVSVPIVHVNGNTFPTRDGTAERDYIHILDVCEAFYLSLKSTFAAEKSTIQIYNVGSGIGSTVLEVIRCLEHTFGIYANIEYQAPKLGDPASHIANIDYIKQCLGWLPRYTLQDVINYTWKAYKK
jgi:UDP-glucose 4-epimerase